MKAGIFEQPAIEDFFDEIEAAQSRRKPKDQKTEYMVIKTKTFVSLYEVLEQILKNQKRILENFEDKTKREKLQEQFTEVIK